MSEAIGFVAGFVLMTAYLAIREIVWPKFERYCERVYQEHQRKRKLAGGRA